MYLIYIYIWYIIYITTTVKNYNSADSAPAFQNNGYQRINFLSLRSPEVPTDFAWWTAWGSSDQPSGSYHFKWRFQAAEQHKKWAFHFLWVNPLWMAIFNSYVSLPEGTTLRRFQAAEQDEMIGWRWWRCEILWNSPCPRQPYFRHVRWYIVVLSFQGTCRMQKKNTHIYI